MLCLYRHGLLSCIWILEYEERLEMYGVRVWIRLMWLRIEILDSATVDVLSTLINGFINS